MGRQQLEVKFDFCSPEAEGSNLGILKTKVVVSEKSQGAKSLSMDPMDYARANTAKECGTRLPIETAFLGIKGALRSLQTIAEKPALDLTTGAEGFRD
jgi:hypothetical protein